MIAESGTRKKGDVDIVDISGRLTFGNALAEIENSILKLIDEGSRRLVINVPGLTSIDSAGIGMLMGCRGKMGGEAGKAAYCRRQGRSRADVRSDAHGHVRRPGYGRRRGLPGVGG